MRTSKMISNISYNTPDFFDSKCRDLVKAGIVEFYAWIFHHGENEIDLDAIKKDHIHFIIQPAKLIQTMDLRNEFMEWIPGNEKPLSPTSQWFYVNSFADWYLYSIHDSAYLSMKHLEREFHYGIRDVITNDTDGLERLIGMIDFAKVFKLNWFSAAKRGLSLTGAIEQGYLDASNLKIYAPVYSAILRERYNSLENMNNKEEKQKWEK